MSTVVTGWVDVTDHGAVAGGGDATAAIITAMSFLNAQNNVLYFPPGVFSIGSPLTGPAVLPSLPSGASVVGCGVGVTTITMTNVNAPIFQTYTTSTPLTPTYASNTIKNITLEYGSTLTSEDAAVYMPSSFGVRLVDVGINNARVGIEIAGSSTTSTYSRDIYCERVTMLLNGTCKYGVWVAGGGSSINQELHFTDCIFLGNTGTTSRAEAAWVIENAAQLSIVNCSERYFEIGVYVIPNDTSASKLVNVSFGNSIFSDNSSEAILFANGTSSNEIADITFTNCRFSNSDYGVYSTVAAGTDFDCISFSNCIFYGNTYNVSLSNASHFQMTGCIAKQGNFGASLANVVDSSIVGCSITGMSTFGVVLAAGCLRVIVENCDLSGNASGAISNTLSSVAPTCMVGNNLGYNPVGYVSPTGLVSGTWFLNPYSQNASIYMTGVTAAAISNDGGTTHHPLPVVGTIVPFARLGPGQSIKLTFGGTKTITWFLD
jgi:hypothetical protein